MGRLTHTVSGGIASFRTPCKVPIESLKFRFLPKQAGSGDPSPINVRPITGWTGLNGRQEGKNLIDKTALTGTDSVWWKGRVVTGYPDHCVTPLIPVKPGASYYLYRISTNDAGQSGQNYVCYFGQDGTTYITQENWNGLSGTGGIYTIPEDVYYIGITVGTSHKDTAMLCSSGLSTDYANYISPRLFPITFPIYTKNLFNPRCPMITNQSKFSLNGDKITQTGSDDRGWKDDDRFPPINLPAGTYTLSCSDGNAINFMTSADGYTESTRFSNGVGTFTIGENIGIKFKHSASSYPVTFTIQIESGNQATDYVPFLYGGAWFGGYYDPVAGELVYSWRKFKVKDYEWTYKPGNHRFQTSLSSGEKANASGSWTNFAISDSYKQSNQQGYQNLMVATYSDYYIYIRDDSYESADDFVEAMGEVEIAYELANPIRIQVTPQDLQAYLDYNNFWSEAGGTDVTYEVVESRHILAERIKAMGEESGHHKKVKWNQLVKDGNFTSRDHWLTSANDYGTVSVNDNIAAWTSTNPELQYYYHTGLTNKQFYLNIPENHRVLVKATVRSSVSRTDSTHRVSIFGMINYENLYAYTQKDVQANTWTDLFGFIRDNRTEGKKITRFKVCYGGTVNDGTIPVGTVLEVKNFMAFDLTEMFGLGNEPQTVDEFERICAINGIDLTTYQPYDTGSDRWLIVP